MPLRADAIIDSLFAKRFKVVRNGKRQFLTGYEAIVAQLLAKGSSGDRRALKTVLKYFEIAETGEDSKAILLRSYGPEREEEEAGEDRKIHADEP